jgi:cytoskeleton protein RodZ
VSSFGTRLRLEREQRGITLDQISRSTKIGTRFLQALEQDHFEQLPGGIFNKGFIRAYARYLGLNEEQAIADYLAATSPGEPSPAVSVIMAQPTVESELAGRFPWGTFAMFLLVIALSFAIWGFYQREPGTPVKDPAANSRGSISLPASSASADSQMPAAEHVAAQSDKPAALPRPATPELPSANAAVSAASLVTASFVVRIKAHDDAWILITADGRKLSEEKLSGGAEKSVRAANRVIIKTRNPEALDFEFNGQKLPTQRTSGESKTLEFGPDGLEVTVSNPR